MSKTTADKPDRRPAPDTVTRTLRMPPKLAELVKETAEAVNLDEADAMRLGLERGLVLLRQQLTGTAALAA